MWPATGYIRANWAYNKVGGFIWDGTNIPDIYVTLPASKYLTVNNWHNVVSVYDMTVADTITLYVYVNGDYVGSSTGTVSSSTFNSMQMAIGHDGAVFGANTIAEVKIFNRALNATEIANEYNRNLDGNGLVAYYNFNDTNSDGSAILNQVGNNDPDTNGILMNGADINAAGMWDTNAGFFDGVDDFVNLGDADEFSFTDGAGNDKPFTVSAWIYTTESPPVGAIVSKLWSSGGYREWNFFFSGNNLYAGIFHYDDSAHIGRSVDAASGSLFSNAWKQVVMTYDGSETIGGIKIYRNGIKVDTDNYTTGSYTGMTDKGKPALIGASSNNAVGNSGRFNGLIDEVKLYNRALTADEILQDYNSWMQSQYYSPIVDAGSSASWNTIMHRRTMARHFLNRSNSTYTNSRQQPILPIQSKL